MEFEEIPLAQEFRPTPEEFTDFEGYLQFVEKQTTQGIVKIVPPKGFKARASYSNINFTVHKPIEQNVSGSQGLYEVLLLQKDSKSLEKYKKMVLPDDSRMEGRNLPEIEKYFWKNIKNRVPLYGSDSPMSLFEVDSPWNLNQLESELSRGLTHTLDGVTSPYCYIGAWKTMFCWHKEDLDLYSINYSHLGKPKVWYGLEPSEADRFEEFCRKKFPRAFEECKEFLRHKSFLVNPLLLLKEGFKVHKIEQNPGEFVVTFAKGFHCGFNVGYNICEAVNFALPGWIKVGKKAETCKCSENNVKIDMKSYESTLRLTGKKKQKDTVLWFQCDGCSKWKTEDELSAKAMKHASQATFYCSTRCKKIVK